VRGQALYLGTSRRTDIRNKDLLDHRQVAS
jgi:hypothetical protein